MPQSPPQAKTHSVAKQFYYKGATRAQLLDYFNNTWTITELIFSALENDSVYMHPPSHGLRHPLIFYYAHPSVLYVNKLRAAGLLSSAVNEKFENVFEVGVDEMSWDDINKNPRIWPSLPEVRDYREKVYELIKNLILNNPRLDPETQPFDQKSPAWALLMGLEHERIHIETSSVLIRELPIELVQKPTAWPDDNHQVPEANFKSTQMKQIPATNVKIGKPSDFPSFGWDNEYGQRCIEISEFEASAGLVTNADFLEFVKAGAYSQEHYWSKEGWGWRSFRNTKFPRFWVPVGPEVLHIYKLRTIFEIVDFKPDYPAIVNFHEAQAFCKWKTDLESSKNEYRLLTEAEHYALRNQVSEHARWNNSLAFGSECATGVFCDQGFSDVFGNIWQWLADEFNPLPGFRVHPLYSDFSTPCFDGLHQMIIGGSFISSGDEASSFARFHFRPHFLQHSGFRLARSLKPNAKTGLQKVLHQKNNNFQDYESQDLLAQYLILHFATEAQTLPDHARNFSSALAFPQRCAQRLIKAGQKAGISFNKALDLGCAVGGSSFVLAEKFSQVVGVDLSQNFIGAANEIQSQGQIKFQLKQQGEKYSEITVTQTPVKNKLEFFVGDACNIETNLTEFDAVLMANLLCRLPDPRACLSQLVTQQILKMGGILALMSPYSWLDQYTPRESWFGTKNSTSQQDVKDFLAPHFKLLEEDEMPLLIREHQRKFQLIFSHLMVFQRLK